VADSIANLRTVDALLGSGPTCLSADDTWLLEGLQSGKEEAYEELIQRYQHPVYNLVARLMDQPSDASDVVQEVFLKVFRKIGSFRAESSLRTWIYRIAVNEARNQHRWFGRHSGREVALEADSGIAPSDWLEDPSPSPFDRARDRETVAVLEEALREMNPAFRSALVLREIEGLSYEEIAEILDLNLGTVKTRILRGRIALRERVLEALSPQRAAATPAATPAASRVMGAMERA